MKVKKSTVNQGSDLDALSSLGPLGGSGVDERRVRHPLPDASPTVETLEEQPLVVVHARPVVKLLVGVVPHGGRLARAVGVPVLDGHQVRIVDRVGRGETQRVRDDGAVDGSPHVDDPVPLTFTEQLVGPVGVVQLDPPPGRPLRLVHVDPGHGGPGSVRVRPSDGVVEDGDLVGAGDDVQQQPFDFGVVHPLDVVVVDELRLPRGRHALDGLKGVLVQTEIFLPTSDVVHLDLDHVLAKVALGSTLGWLLDVIVRRAAVFGVPEKVEFGPDRTSRHMLIIRGRGRTLNSRESRRGRGGEAGLGGGSG